MQKYTTLPLLLKGFLGFVLLWQTACTNTSKMGMDGEDAEQIALKRLEQNCLNLIFSSIAQNGPAAEQVALKDFYGLCKRMDIIFLIDSIISHTSKHP